MRQSYDALLKEGLVRQTKTQTSPKVQKGDTKGNSSGKRGRKAHVKLKSIKIRLGTNGKRGKIIHGRGSPAPRLSSSDDDSDLEPLVTKLPPSKRKAWMKMGHKSKVKVAGLIRLPERSLAKQLLVKAKAKQKQQKQTGSALALGVDRKGPATCHRKQFVLPTVSSRSARKIIPNKRLLEDSYGDITSLSTVKKVKTEETSLTPDQSNTLAPDISTPLVAVPPAIDPKISLFDQPLIVEGKRQRKPSMRLIRQLSDDTFVEHKRKQEDKRKVLPSSGSADSLEDVDRSLAATKRHGQSILRKAKLRLNQAALNRSKAALARSLKRKMRREQAASSSSSQQFLPLDVKPLSVQVSPIKFGVMSPDTPVFGAATLGAGQCLMLCLPRKEFRTLKLWLKFRVIG